MQPRRYSLAQDFHATYRGTVTATPANVAFTPIGYKAPAVPTGVPGTAVAALVAYRIVVSNPGTAVIRVAPILVQAPPGNTVYPSLDERAVPAFVDPAAYPAPDAAAISIPAGAIAFEICVRAYGLAIDCPAGTADVMVQAYGSLTLLS